MHTCERCKEKDARVRLDSVLNGERESHYYCRSCAEEIMGGSLENVSGNNGNSMSGLFGNMFGQSGAPGEDRPSGPSGAPGSRQGRGQGRATAQRTADKHSKTPTLDQFGRDLTAEARE